MVLGELMDRCFRLIVHEAMKSSENMAIDEAILKLRPKLGMDTLRLYMWKPSTVSIGYFQNLNDAVDLECVKKRRFDVVRRMTGGGALLHAEEMELTYSIVVSEGSLSLPKDVASSSMMLAEGLLQGLKLWGVKAEMKGYTASNKAQLCYLREGVSDILVNGRKISGSAQKRVGEAILQHGTLLLDLDLEAWLEVVKVPQDITVEKLSEKMTSIKHELGSYNLDEVRQKVIEGFSEALKIKLMKASLSKEEVDLAKLLKLKYGSMDWTLQARELQDAESFAN